MFLESRVRPVRGADNLTAICEPIVWTNWDPHNPTGLHGLLRGIALLFFIVTVYATSSMTEESVFDSLPRQTQALEPTQPYPPEGTKGLSPGGQETGT
jgi:hypothetical protein